jgi:hypothetical protein
MITVILRYKQPFVDWINAGAAVQENEGWPFARPPVGDAESFDLDLVHSARVGMGVHTHRMLAFEPPPSFRHRARSHLSWTRLSRSSRRTALPPRSPGSGTACDGC